MKKKTIAGLIVLVALAAGVFLFIREQQAQECRQAAVFAATSSDSYSGDAKAALDLANQIHRDKTADCYVKGLISAPPP